MKLRQMTTPGLKKPKSTKYDTAISIALTKAGVPKKKPGRKKKLVLGGY